MFHLNTGVHFHEIEVPVVVYQKFNGAGVVIAARLCRTDSGFLHGFPQFRCHQRAGAFLQHFLVPPLHAAITLAQCHGVAHLVCNDLDLHVMRPHDQLFQIDFIVAEEQLGFFLCHGHLLFQLVFPIDPANAASAAAGRGFHQYRIADLCGDLLGFFHRRNGTVRTGYYRHAGSLHGFLGTCLVAQHGDRLR